jgi:DNA polymerase-3 subunit epsilon
MDFVAIDVETANADMASICQIGIATFDRGALACEWKTYVDPQDYFDGMNVSIHGIDANVVAGSPTFGMLADTVMGALNGQVVVTHTAFDRVAIYQAGNKCKTSPPSCTWLDSACVARRTWKEFSRSGYGLASVCDWIGYTFNHHDALEDAKAAGNILLAAMAHTGLNLDAWLTRVQQRIAPTLEQRIAREGNPDGLLYGEILVFTGAMMIPRREAADYAASVGCEVGASITKRTTILVVGDQDVQKLAGHEKSSKHRKVEQLIKMGQPIRILRETDFRELVKLSTSAVDPAAGRMV